MSSSLDLPTEADWASPHTNEATPQQGTHHDDEASDANNGNPYTYGASDCSPTGTSTSTPAARASAASASGGNGALTTYNGKHSASASSASPTATTASASAATAPSSSKQQHSSSCGSSAVVLYEPPADFLQRLKDSKQERPPSEVIEPSPFAALPAAKRMAKVVQEFNINVTESVIESAGVRAGNRVEPGFFLLAQCNNVPEVALGTGGRLNLVIKPGYTKIGYIGGVDGNGQHRQTEPIIGAFGSYIINVPLGRLARIWSGNTPRLLAEGLHVVHDSQFRYDASELFANVERPYVRHGTLHIIRVPAGYFAKVTVESRHYLLPNRQAPYVFSSTLLEYHDVVPANEPYISFGTLHLLRVPAGYLCKAKLGNQALLLESRSAPYFFDDAYFSLSPPDESGSHFTKANVRWIHHGTIDRVWPGVQGGVELAIVRRDEEMLLLDRLTTIDDPVHAVLGFLDMGMRTCIFPSKKVREERKRDNPRATANDTNFEPMTTKDSLKVGLKLLVAFQVTDPHRMLRILRIEEVETHVENLAVSDMARAVQNSTSQNFLHSSNKHRDDLHESEMSITDRVRVELGSHLEECGLKLVRFSIEEAKVLDEDLAREMSKQALIAAKAAAEQGVLEQMTAIARNKAEMQAMALRVAQEQENEIRISKAKSELEAERLKAEAILVRAAAEQKSSEMRGEQFRKYPELLQLELVRLQMEALKGTRVALLTPEMSQTPFADLSRLNTLFNSMSTASSASAAAAAKETAARGAANSQHQQHHDDAAGLSGTGLFMQ